MILPSHSRSGLTNAVARAPNGYWTGDPEKESQKTGKNKTAKGWHEGPPRVGTFSMRATRFRQAAGCLSWSTKDGTVPKNQRILDIIPAEFKDPAINSTKGWRDLNAAEIKSIQAGHKRTPQKARKKNRAAKAERDLQEDETLTTESIDLDGVTHSYGGYNGSYGALQDDDEMPVATYQVHRITSVHNGQQGDHHADQDIQFAQNDDIASMHARYNGPQANSTKPKTAEKRKRRTSSGTTGTKHIEGQRPTKRAEKRTAKHPQAPNYQTTSPPAPSIKNFMPTTGLQMPTQDQQLDEQDPGLPPTATEGTESFLHQMYQYISGDKSTEEDDTTQQSAQMPPVHERYIDGHKYTDEDNTVQQPSQMPPFNSQYIDSDICEDGEPLIEQPEYTLPDDERYELPINYGYQYPEHNLSSVYWP